MTAVMVSASVPLTAQNFVSDEEFRSNWGLEAVQAQAAYARELTGSGQRIGMFDSGVALNHTEFSHKNNIGIQIGELSDHGGPCNNTTLLTDSACFSSRGDTVAVDYLDFDEDMWQNQVNKGSFSQTFMDLVRETYAGARYATHGTHVAGTMVADRDGSGIQGLAYQANVTTARIFSNSYTNSPAFIESLGGDLRKMGITEDGINLSITPNAETFASAYQQLIQQGIRLINHSWGLVKDPETVEDLDTLYTEADNASYLQTFIQPSLTNQVIQVWAAGNNQGHIAGMYASIPRFAAAVEPYWLSVVNLGDDGNISGTSSLCAQTKNWCITAPGTLITSTVPTNQPNGVPIRDANGKVVGLEVTGTPSEYGYSEMTGTSMAAPHATAALAILMQRYPYLDNALIRDILLTTATDLGDPGIDDTYGWGLINMQKALNGPGQLRQNVLVDLNQMPGGRKTWTDEAWDDWINDISGPGQLSKSGAGWLRLSGDNTFAGITIHQGTVQLTGNNHLQGDVTVNGQGTLLVDGQLDGSAVVIKQGNARINGSITNGTTTIEQGGRLNGYGNLGPVTNHGTISPGNSVGAQSIHGDYVQGPTGTYLAELDNGQRADLLAITGTASLDGTLQIRSTDGGAILGQNYKILTAAKGVNGRFASVDTSAISPLLALTLRYSTDTISFDITRGQALATIAKTPNQLAIAQLLDRQNNQNTLLQRTASRLPANAQRMLDRLSGEIHASIPHLLAQESFHARDTILTRVRPDLANADEQSDRPQHISAWAQVSHHEQELSHRHNGSAPARSQSTMPLIGADVVWREGFRIGGFGGNGRSQIHVNERDSRANTSVHLFGLYAGQQWSGFGVRFGTALATHHIKTRRDIQFSPQLTEKPQANYDARTFQYFVEAGYQWPLAQFVVEPYAQLAKVRVNTHFIQEHNSIAALIIDRQSQTTQVATLGLRFNLPWLGDTHRRWGLNGSAAYRHTSGNLTTPAYATIAQTGRVPIFGAEQTRQAMIADLGLSYQMTPNCALTLGYQGLFGSGVQDHYGQIRVLLGL